MASASVTPSLVSAPTPMPSFEAGSIPNLDPNATLYGYVPTLWVCALFIALFSLSTFLHIYQAAKYHIWWLYVTIVIGGICEILGWAGRLWSSKEPRQLNPYLMQICMTILAPSWMTAANFTILGIIIRLLGSQYSWLKPRMCSSLFDHSAKADKYTDNNPLGFSHSPIELSRIWLFIDLIIFLTFDLIALVGQAVGGAQASLAAQAGRDPTPGGNIMCYFIIVQMVAIGLYTICACEFLLRYHFNKPVRSKPYADKPSEEEQKTGHRVMDRGIKRMLLGLATSTLFVLIRSVYRTIELLDGWSGRIITNQLYFNVLDGAAIVVAIYAINIFHPGFLLQDNARTRGKKPKPAVIEADDAEKGDTTAATTVRVDDKPDETV